MSSYSWFSTSHSLLTMIIRFEDTDLYVTKPYCYFTRTTLKIMVIVAPITFIILEKKVLYWNAYIYFKFRKWFLQKRKCKKILRHVSYMHFKYLRLEFASISILNDFFTVLSSHIIFFGYKYTCYKHWCIRFVTSDYVTWLYWLFPFIMFIITLLNQSS